MIGLKTFMIGVTVLATTIAIPTLTLAQDNTARTVEQFTCKDVMRESGSSRETAVAFMHGYLLGKSGSSEFDMEILASRTDAFFDHCLDNPSDGAMDSMSKISTSVVSP